jgi:Mg-chelatase subunit ChlD
LNQENRERYGVKPGDLLSIKKGDLIVKARVDVSSREDGETVCRLNPNARESLGVQTGDTVEICPSNRPMGPVGRPMTVQSGFKEDSDAGEPIIRLSQKDRNQMGLEVGGYVHVKHGEHKIPVRVEVGAASDADFCRLNPAARNLLEVEIGAAVEIIPPETLILLIDISGSMNDGLGWRKSKLQATQSAIDKLLQNKKRAEEQDLVGVVAFEDHSHLIAAPSTRYETIMDRVNQLYAEGGTGLFEGMEYALKLLRDASGLRRMLILTDGVPTTTNSDPILKLTREAKELSVVIDTIGVGGSGRNDRYDELLLRAIASLTGGRFLHVDDVRALEEIFLMLGADKKFPQLSR